MMRIGTAIGVVVMWAAAIAHRMEAAPNWLSFGTMVAYTMWAAMAVYYIWQGRGK